MARPGFAASGQSRIARGSSSPQKASVPFGGPEKALTAPSSEGAALRREGQSPRPPMAGTPL